MEKENISMQRRGTKKEKEESVWKRNFYLFIKVEKEKEENIWRRRDILCRGEENGERKGGI